VSLPTTLVTSVGIITLGVSLASLTVVHDGHQHVFTNATVSADFPYGDSEVRFSIQTVSIAIGLLASQVLAFSVI
jgi:hypothetical protein